MPLKISDDEDMLLVNVTVGTPPKILTLIIDVTSPISFIWDSEYYSIKGKTNYFDCKNSTTCSFLSNNTEFFYRSKQIKGQIFSDHFTLSVKTNVSTDMQAFLVSSSDLPYQGMYHGILGLLPNLHKGAHDKFSLLSLLLESKSIHALQVAIFNIEHNILANKTKEINNTLGKNDTLMAQYMFEQGNLTTFDAMSVNRLPVIPLRTIRIQDAADLGEKEYYAYCDTVLPHISFPRG